MTAADAAFYLAALIVGAIVLTYLLVEVLL